MNLEQALSQIEEIHGQLARGEVSRDFRAWATAAMGALALGAGGLQATILGPTPRPLTWVGYWLALAAACALVGALDIGMRYARETNAARRGRTRVVLGQFAPALAAGGLLTTAFCTAAPETLTAWLPGCWTLCFSLGLFAARPCLPKMIGWAAVFYLIAAAVLLRLAPEGLALAPWAMGLTFGAGQFLTAFILYWNLERESRR